METSRNEIILDYGPYMFFIHIFEIVYQITPSYNNDLQMTLPNGLFVKRAAF